MSIDTLIAKYLNNECSPEEIEKINRWKKSSPENESIFKRSEEAWHLAYTNRKHIYISKEKIWNRIQKHISRKYSLPTMMRVAGIAASVAFLIGWALPYLTDSAENKTTEPRMITLFVPGGVCSKTILPDSTVVWLNASSSINYPDRFNGNTRTIELTGEAFFDVKRDETKPFIIKSGDMQVKVLGTSFNFKHYAGDTHAVLAVETGKVTLSTTGASKSTSLEAGKYATINNRTLKTTVYDMPSAVPAKKDERQAEATPKMIENEKNTNQFSAWRNYRMIFRDEAFQNILNELSRRYNAEFEIRDEEINDYVYTATFDDMSLEDILKLLKLSAPIDYKINSLTSNTTNAYEKRKVIIYLKK